MTSPADSGAASGVGTHEFRADTRQLLDIVTHSLYSNREIFLRELISNASDALDRLRFAALTTEGLLESSEILEIRLDTDPVARTLTIGDNGIGMSRQEVIDNIGTIAKSGTREVLRDAESSGSSSAEIAELIGRFGVGFYSSFMVADKVTLVTRSAGEQNATRWESTGDGQFEIADDHRFLRGTTITLHLKPVDEENGIEDYTQPHILERIVHRYSDFVSYPIRAKLERSQPKLDGEGKPVPGSAEPGGKETTLNSMQPIWTRPTAEVSEEEHFEFYKHIAHDWNEPLDRLQLKAEGRIEYQALLYFPSKAPFDLFFRDQRVGLQLYVRRVLIQDRNEELLPPYLRFLRGVVDSADLPLNVSREMLQQDRHITQIRRWITRKVLDRLKEMLSEERDKYTKLWHEFGRVLKEGVGTTPDAVDRLAPLLLFESSNSDDELTTLAEYVARMADDQEKIYYLTGESRTLVENAPQLEGLRHCGREVLYLVDPVDEFVVQSLTEFEGKKLRSAATGTDDLATDDDDDSRAEEKEEREKQYGDLLQHLQARLQDSVKQVRLSNRLTTSPACLVGEEGDLSPQMERILRQTETAFGEIGTQKRILELNPEHEVIQKLQARFDENRDDPEIDSYAPLLLGYALLSEGSKLPEPGEFNHLLAELMAKGLT